MRVVSLPVKRAPLAARRSSATVSTPSTPSTARLASGPPAPYSPMWPSVRTTRWQGMTKGTGLPARAEPTARTARGRVDLARDPGIGPHLAVGDLHRLAQHRLLELRQPAEVDGRSAGALAAQPPGDLVGHARRHGRHAPNAAGPCRSPYAVSKPSGSPARSTAVMPPRSPRPRRAARWALRSPPRRATSADCGQHPVRQARRCRRPPCSAGPSPSLVPPSSSWPSPRARLPWQPGIDGFSRGGPRAASADPGGRPT